MKLELLFFGITGFLIYNTYHDGKYTKMFHIGQKYIKMSMFGFIGITLYLFIKRNPDESKTLLTHATDIVRFMPIDRNTADLITPIFDLTSMKDKMNGSKVSPQTKRMMNSGGNSTTRSVSETKKKFVASRQGWKCAHCQQQLDASFQTDHIIRLADGGTNHVNNLEALCCNCHGKKTALENMK